MFEKPKGKKNRRGGGRLSTGKAREGKASSKKKEGKILSGKKQTYTGQGEKRANVWGPCGKKGRAQGERPPWRKKKKKGQGEKAMAIEKRGKKQFIRGGRAPARKEDGSPCQKGVEKTLEKKKTGAKKHRPHRGEKKKRKRL